MILRRNFWKIALRQGISLLLLLCLLTGMVPAWVAAEPAAEQTERATRASAADYISIAAALAEPLVLTRRLDPDLAGADIHKIDGSYIAVFLKPVGSVYYAIDPYAVNGNILGSVPVDIHVAAEICGSFEVTDSLQYIEGLDPEVGEKLAMTYRYVGDPDGAANGYLTDIAQDGNTSSFAFRVIRSDGAEMQFSDGGPGIESYNGTATIGLKFSSTKTERPTVRIYRRKRTTGNNGVGGYAFQCNAHNNNAAIKDSGLVSVTSGTTPYTELATGRSSYYLFEYFGEEESTYLYTAITEAAAYLQKVVSAEPDSANTTNFIAAFNNAVSTYNKYNVLPMPAYDGTKPEEEMTKAAESLVAFYSFIDIPVEILDFRSDLFMMEHENDYFGLVHDYKTNPNLFSTSAGNLTLPGQVQYRSQNVPHFRTGLMMDNLHNGYPMYKEEVVEFVAKLLYAATDRENMYDNDNSKRLTLLTNYKVDWNRTFYDLLRDKNVPLGDLNSVIKATAGGEYGDSLSWSNTDKNSCYALAYYMLTNLWRPVAGESGYAYNTPIPERNSLRLFKDIDGAYTIDANQSISYSSYMGNEMPRVNQNVSTQAPCFTPIDGLGFEKNEKETDLSPAALDGYKKTNYNFTMHAYGSFVYYADQDLYFEFRGDDDVYFYVNDTMALDLGGTHSAAEGRVDLNDKADFLGLVDGEVYTFHMFYAERRIAGSNLRFSTNIKIVDTDTLTTKGQYLDTQGGASMVDPTTGKGPELIDYAPVNVGDTVAYSFDLHNTRAVPVKKVSFSDSTLGVTASHAVVKLNSITRITDLRLYYTTISGGVLDSYDPVVKTESEMEILINTANQLSGSTYGSLPAGCYRVNITSDGMLKNLLALGIPVNCKLSLYGFKRVVTEGDIPYVNTVFSDCLTIDNRLITGTASRVITAFVAPKGRDTTLVLDYGKAIQITAAELKESITIAPGSSVAVGNCVGLTTVNGYSGQLLKVLPSTITKHRGTQGEFSFSSTGITYKPFKFLDGMDRVFAVFSISNCTVTEAGGKTVTYPYILLQLRTVPATSVYYEAESFKSELTYLEKRTDSSGVETFYSDWEEDGAANTIKEEGFEASDDLQAFKSVGQDHPYGYDPSYADDTLLSNGRSLYVEGAGVVVPNAITNDNYTQIEFSFVGTGFDIISRTGAQQATIRVSVYDDPGKANDHRIKSITVNNKGELELYQIPVVSVQGLEHGTYYVSLWVNDKITGAGFPQLPGVDLSGLTRGNEFYFDAIWIYDPIDTRRQNLSEDQQIAYDAYCTDKEVNPAVKEIRDSLLDGTEMEGLTSLTKGAMFVDAKVYTTPPTVNDNGTPATVLVSEHLAVSAATYKKVGPKNEVYLSPGQAIAFKLELANGKVPVRVDVGAKTIMGDEVTLAAGFVESPTTAEDTLKTLSCIAENLETSTAMYYSLNTNGLSADQDSYIVIYNALTENYSPEEPGNILSVTDLKLSYAEEMDGKRLASEPYYFAVDNRTLEAAAVFMRAFPEIPILDRDAKIMHSLNLTGDISVNYVISKADLEGCDDITMEVAVPVYEGDQQTGSKRVTLSPVAKGVYYYFTLPGITAVQMNDEIEAVLHWSKDGQSYYSDTDVYSISQYAYTQMNKTGSESLKALCADLLRYGAQAQIFKGYRLNVLADSDMSGEQRGYCTDLDTVTFGNTNVIRKDLESPTVPWVGKTLNLGSKVTLKFVFSINGYSGNLDDLSLRVSYTDIDGKLVTATVRELEIYNATAGQYAFSFDGLLAAELRTVVSAQIYAGDTPVSCTLQYSADTYGRNKTGTLLDLCKALMAYSDSARSYFEK